MIVHHCDALQNPEQSRQLPRAEDPALLRLEIPAAQRDPTSYKTPNDVEYLLAIPGRVP